MLTPSAYLLPSVPTMLIDEQRGDITEMIEALQAAGRRTAADAPEAIVVVSPRWVSTGAFLADDSRRHRSVVDLPEFGVEPRHDCPGARGARPRDRRAAPRSWACAPRRRSTAWTPGTAFRCTSSIARGSCPWCRSRSATARARSTVRGAEAIRLALERVARTRDVRRGGRAVVEPARVQPAPRGAGVRRTRRARRSPRCARRNWPGDRGRGGAPGREGAARGRTAAPRRAARVPAGAARRRATCSSASSCPGIGTALVEFPLAIADGRRRPLTPATTAPCASCSSTRSTS